ncbi:hypothetical protein I9W82_005685 [Candida metapsilosis]|uniref:Uncharacterized protein n=1 Tax=Candida metapsilosis TaxID=273372 RepID=A0A8H8DAG2_9ASCO|nr:hypothetical protein I9W82_005685 [Candida metapsilosis]
MKTSKRLGNGKPRRGTRASKTHKSKSTSPTPRDSNLSHHHPRNIFARDNKLSSLFSSQTESTPDPSTRRTNLPYKDDDEGIFERDSSPPLDIRRKRRSLTPPGQLKELTYDLSKESPPGELSHDFFNISKPKNSKKKKKSASQASQERLKSQLQSPLKGHNDVLDRGSQRDHSHGARRISYNSRGRRVSSMGNGFEGEPHQDVPVSEYYKHLDTSIPESDRMRQLLIWNLKAELDKEENDMKAKQGQISSDSQTVNNIAKTINDELIQSLKDYSISMDWKEGSSQRVDSVLLPNPKNKTNLENIKKYSSELNALKSEKREWELAYQRLTSLIDTVATPSETEAFANSLSNENVQSELALDPNFVHVERNYLDIHQNLSKVETDVESLFFSARQMNELTEKINSRGQDELQNDISNLLTKSLPKSHPEKPVDSKDILRAICLRAKR